jgi:glycosyltransferase involved in cell wall biosynthesis
MNRSEAEPANILVLIPCLNEELSIASTIKEIRAASNSIRKIVIIDNGSTDRTAEIALNEGAEVLHEPRKGKGFAFRRGLTSIDKEIKLVFLVDGDGTYAIDKLEKACELVAKQGFDMVVGERSISENSQEAFRFLHKTGNHALTFLQKITFGTEISDALSGWRLMSRGFALSFQGGDTEFELEAELNAHAYRLRASTANVRIDYRERTIGSSSKLRTYSDGWKILKKNLGLWRGERPFRAYSIMSLPWFILGIFLMGRALENFLETGLVPKFPSLIVSIGSFLISLNLWIAGVILERANVQRTAFARNVYLQEMLPK